MEVTWTIFKSFVSSRGLSIQWVDLNDTYWLKAFDNIFELSCKLYKLNEDSTEIVDFETNFKSAGNKSITTQSTPFASKSIGAKKLFKRAVGISSSVSTGDNIILYTIPYAWVKITGMEIIGAEVGDVCSLLVLDSAAGTYSQVPNYTLNQFGFTINLAKDYYEHKSEYDADLYLNMQIKIVYNSISTKTARINLILNEMK